MTTENKTIAYLRVSTDGQELKNQKLEILECSQQHSLTINDWVEGKMKTFQKICFICFGDNVPDTISLGESYSTY